jgi:hypothetical protein
VTTQSAHKDERDLRSDQPAPWTWAWLKEYTGYVVTVLPYVSAGLVLIPSLNIWIKAGILFIFAVLVLYVRIWHEKAGIEVTDGPKRQKRM